MKKIILFDIDYTLSDRDYLRFFGRNYLGKLVHKTVDELNPILDEIIKESRSKFGIFDIYFYAKRVGEKFKKPKLEQKMIDMFLIDYPYDQALYPEVKTVIHRLTKKYTLGIQTDGQEIFQLKKIEAIERFFDQKYIFVFKNKQEEIFDKIKRIENLVIILDDKPAYVDKLSKLGIDSILIERGYWAKDYEDNREKYPNIKKTAKNLNDSKL